MSALFAELKPSSVRNKWTSSLLHKQNGSVLVFEIAAEGTTPHWLTLRIRSSRLTGDDKHGVICFIGDSQTFAAYPSYKELESSEMTCCCCVIFEYGAGSFRIASLRTLESGYADLSPEDHSEMFRFGD